MADKHHYSKPVPSNMTPQRGGTPRNTGSPPPDLPPERFSGRTQMAKQGYTPQPGQRPHESKQPPIGPQKPTGTVEPERRGAKGGDMGGVPGSVGYDVSVPGDAFSVANPSPTPGYAKPGHPERR